MPSVNSLQDLSPQALDELRRWLEAWQRNPKIDSTVNRGQRDGVHSVEVGGTLVDEGMALTATGDGGSTWSTVGNPGLPTLIRSHIGSDLVSWWRMGESASPLLDYAQNSLGDKPLLIQTGTGGTHVTYDVTGGLTSGDDGALQFGYDQTVSDGDSGGTTHDFFSAIDSTNHRWAFSGTASFTAECLIKPTATWNYTGLRGMVGTMSGITDDTGWAITAVKDTGGVLPGFYRASGGGTGTAIAAASVAPYGSWSHVAVTYDGTTMRLFVNGVQVASSASAISQGSVTTIRVGKITFAPSDLSRYFYGVVDEVAVYSAVLTPTEILQHAAGGVNLPTTVSADSTTVYANGS